jgi:hypothetical protein
MEAYGVNCVDTQETMQVVALPANRACIATNKQGSDTALILSRIQDTISPHSNFLVNRWYHRPGAISKSNLDRDLLPKEVILNQLSILTIWSPPFNFASLNDLIVKSANGYLNPALPGSG